MRKTVLESTTSPIQHKMDEEETDVLFVDALVGLHRTPVPKSDVHACMHCKAQHCINQRCNVNTHNSDLFFKKLISGPV